MLTAHNMMLSGDPSTPLYQQIKDAILLKIANGEWRAGEMIPSENQLAEALKLSRMTINRPLRELANEGWLKRVHGKGTFVAEPPRRAHLLELVSIADEIAEQGKEHSARILKQETIDASEDIAERFQMRTGSRLFHVQIVHSQDGIPIQFEDRLVNPHVVPHFLDIDFRTTTPADYLISQLRPDELEHVVQAIVPTELMVRELDIQSSEPCLKLRRRTWMHDTVVTSVDLIYPSSRYELGARFSPQRR